MDSCLCVFAHLYVHYLLTLTSGYYILSVRTTKDFKRLPVGLTCSVYFHAIDIVLGRKECHRQAWSSRVHYPKVLFHPNKGRKGARTSTKLQNYGCFKRMLAVKTAVYENHINMKRLYEKYCSEAETQAYWGDDDVGEQMEELEPAEDPNEKNCEDGF